MWFGRRGTRRSAAAAWAKAGRAMPGGSSAAPTRDLVDEVQVVELVVVEPGDGDLRAAVLDLAPRLDQEQFSGRARETLPWADRSASMTPFAIVADGEPAGFGILDRTALHLVALTPAPERAVLLRSFYVDAAHQGRGIGRRAAAAVGPLARRIAPGAQEVILTVDVENRRAHHTYVSAGFVDRGERYLGGTLGPQHVLRLPQ